MLQINVIYFRDLENEKSIISQTCIDFFFKTYMIKSQLIILDHIRQQSPLSDERKTRINDSYF